jgi:hypothetical protein
MAMACLRLLTFFPERPLRRPRQAGGSALAHLLQQNPHDPTCVLERRFGPHYGLDHDLVLDPRTSLLDLLRDNSLSAPEDTCFGEINGLIYEDNIEPRQGTP